MSASSSHLLETLAVLRIAMVRFRITRDLDAESHTPPRVTRAKWARSLRPLPAFPVPALFSAFALRPLKGTYTLHVAAGTLCYDPSADAGPAAEPGLRGKS